MTDPITASTFIAGVAGNFATKAIELAIQHWGSSPNPPPWLAKPQPAIEAFDQALRQALNRLKLEQRNQQQLLKVLFEASKSERAAELLGRCVSPEPPSAGELTEAWLERLNPEAPRRDEMRREIEPIARNFLGLFTAQLRQQPTFLPVFMFRDGAETLEILRQHQTHAALEAKVLDFSAELKSAGSAFSGRQQLMQRAAGFAHHNPRSCAVWSLLSSRQMSPGSRSRPAASRIPSSGPRSSTLSPRSGETSIGTQDWRRSAPLW